MGAYSRNKGKRGELELVHLLRDFLGIDVNRNYKQVAEAQHGDIEQLVGGHLLEVKNCAVLALPTWWAQAVTAAKARGAIPCVVYKVARKRDIADRWRFVLPLPAAWDTGAEWRYDLRYAANVGIEGFALLARERGLT
jgi:hypothetical protein